MGMFAWLLRFFGSIIFGLGITLFILVLVCSSLISQLDNMDETFSDSIDNFVIENAGVLVEEMLDAQGLDWDSVEIACDAGEIEGDFCSNLTLYRENPAILLDTEIMGGQTESIINQIVPMIKELFTPAKMVVDNMGVFFIIITCCLFIGGLLVFLGVGRNLFKFFSRILFSITWGCLGWCLGLWLIVEMEASDFLNYLPLGHGFEGIMLEFSLQLILDVIKLGLDPLVMPLLFVGLFTLVLSVGLMIYAFIEKRKSKK